MHGPTSHPPPLYHTTPHHTTPQQGDRRLLRSAGQPRPRNLGQNGCLPLHLLRGVLHHPCQQTTPPAHITARPRSRLGRWRLLGGLALLLLCLWLTLFCCFLIFGALHRDSWRAQSALGMVSGYLEWEEMGFPPRPSPHHWQTFSAAQRERIKRATASGDSGG